MGRQQNISEATAQKIESEVRRIAEDGVNDARCPFTEKQHELDALARGLLGYETLTSEEIRSYLYGRPPVHGSALPAARRGRPRETQVAWSLNRRANQCLAKRVCGPCTCLLEKLLGAEGCGHKHAFRRRSNHALAVQSYLGHKRRRI